MDIVALSGQDTIIINNRVFTAQADADNSTLEFPNEIATVKNGKNGNAIFGLNENGKQANLKLRIVRGSSDDKFLLNLLSQQQANFAGTVLLTGEFIKQIGDGKGNVAADTYVASSGIFKRIPGAKSNVDGDSEQSIAMWDMTFAKCVRVIT